MKFEGVFVANVTPFDLNTQLDLGSMRAHTEWLVAQGVHGLVPCGTTGEASTLQRAERIKVIELCQKVGHHTGIQVIAGCGSNSTYIALELLKEASDLGCHAGLVVTPYYNKPTPLGVRAHFEFLAEKSPLPIILYHVPSRTNVALSVDVTLDLLKHPNIAGIKEASGVHSQWLTLASNMDTSTKALLAGDDDAFATVLSMGGCGIISATANVVPRMILQIYAYFRQGKVLEAFRLQKQLNPLVRALFSETNPSPMKQALSILKKMYPTVRLPLVEVSPLTREVIANALTSLEVRG